MHLKMSSGKWRPFCRGLNVLIAIDGCHETRQITDFTYSEYYGICIWLPAWHKDIKATLKIMSKYIIRIDLNNQ